MIVVRIELWPFGDPRPLRQIALMGIVNVGPADDGRHAYEARSEGRIAHLTHTRSDGALTLVARAIEALAEGSESDPIAADVNETDARLPPPHDRAARRLGQQLRRRPGANTTPSSPRPGRP